MTLSPPPPQNVAVAGSSSMTPDWWRWIRELKDSVVSVEDLSALGDGTLIQNQSLVVGNNTIAHGLGRSPNGWVAMRPVGAFGTSGGGGGTVYPFIPKYFTSYASDNPGVATTELSFTLGRTPVEGSVIVAAIFRDTTEALSDIGSISQTGVTWSEAVAVPGNPSALSLMLWTGLVSSGASASGTINFNDSNTAESAAVFVEFEQASSATPTGGASAYKTGGSIEGFDSSDYLTEPDATAGDIVVKAMQIATVSSNASYNAFAGSHFQTVGALSCPGALSEVVMWAGVAQDDQKYPLCGLIDTLSNSSFYSIVLSSDIGGVSSAAVTIPHGVREVSSDATNIVVDSVSAVAMDFWVF